MLVFSWNCRGLRNDPTVLTLKSFLTSSKPNFVFISETKCGLEYSEDKIATLGYTNSHVVPSVGRSGGLWVLWDDNFDISVMSSSHNLVHCAVSTRDSTPCWNLFCIYGPPSMALRRRFWRELTSKMDGLTDPWMCVGDMNSIVDAREKRGGNGFNKASTLDFNNWRQKCGAMDLGFHGQAFTWTNRRVAGHNIAERLDRCLVDAT